MKKNNELSTNIVNREARKKLVDFRDSYFTSEQLKQDLKDAGAIVRLQFYKILLDFTMPKPVQITEDGHNYVGIEFTPNKEQSKRKIYTFENILKESNIEFNGNGEAV